MPANLILASTSPYRAELLAKYGLEFSQQSPICDETPLPNEAAKELVLRLSIAKAQSLTASFDTNTTIIGSDQVADLDGRIIGKPGDHETAVAQLQAQGGRQVVFYTGLCVIKGAEKYTCVVPTTVQFRSLEDDQINRYLAADTPYNCAGSFKSESLGTAIVESMTSDDPSALIGLPLIKLAEFLTRLGTPVP